MKIDKLEVESVEQVTSPSFKKTKSLRPFFVLFSVLGLLVILTVFVYRLPMTNPFVKSVASIIPYPAATVDGSIITMRTYILEHEALTQYLKTTGYDEMPSDDVLQQTILDALINKTVIRKLAVQNGVKIDQDLVDQYYQDVVDGQTSEDDFTKELSDTFGWSKTDFKKRIVESIVLALQMSDFVSKDETLQAPARAKVEQVYDRLKAGEDFITVANEINAQSVTSFETDLGYQNVSDLPEEWKVVKDIPVGDLPEIIELEQGYAIATITDRIEAAEDSQIHLMAVMIPKTTLEDLVSEYLEGAKVRYFVQ
jgi:parvulin-like peptidyl-prolyl isomerase